MTKSTQKKASPKMATPKKPVKRKPRPALGSAMVSSEAKAAAKTLAAMKAPKKKPTTKTKSTAKPKLATQQKTVATKVTAKKKTVSAKKPVTAKKPTSTKKAVAVKAVKTVKKPTAAKTRTITSSKPKSRVAKSATAKAPAKRVAVKKTATTKSAVKVTAKKRTSKPVLKKQVVKPSSPKRKAPVKAKKASAPTRTVSVKKSLVKKAPVKKAQAKKSPVKKAAAKIAAIQTKSQPQVKTKTPQNQSRRKTSPSSANTLKTLNDTIANLETRMKRANTLTRKSVKSLEIAVTALETRTRKDGSTQKAALTRKVNQLSAKLTDMIAQTQNSVNSELKAALNNPNIANLESALFRANTRLTQAEELQAAAISKINRHLASIATTVEARLTEEAKARKVSLAALKSEAHTRMDTIERDTATALSRAGDKIAELATEMQNRNDATELSIREKVSEIALQTQTEFEQYRGGLETRIEAIETNESIDARKLEQSIASLTSRIEGLEYGLAALPIVEPPVDAPHAEVQLPPLPLASAPTAPQLTLVETPTFPQPEPPVHTPAPSVLPDAFSPMAAIPVEQTDTTPPNPYLAAAQPEAEPEPAAQDSHIPVEFDPSQYQMSQQGGQAQAMAQTQNQIKLTPPQTELAPVLTNPVSLDTMLPQTPDQTAPDLPPFESPLGVLSPRTVSPTSESIAATTAAVPYADPAYAEVDPTMATSRIGGETGRNVNLPKLPKLTGRNLRVAALATGVAVVGLIAVKGVLGNGSTSPTSQMATTEQPVLPTNDIAPISVAEVPMVEPIGDYADNRAVEVTGEAATTLNSAAAAGEPIAQFQLGLSYLENGRTDEGVTLIRKSANKNQPAAQYRLAKLYEIGEGVEQDAEMARQLTERAARNGNRIAMHDLALYYAEGRGGVTADLPTAAKWFEKAAERGVVDSQFNLGVLFESGQGLPKNMNDAFVWYSIAAGQGDQFAKTRIAVLKDSLPEADVLTANSRVENFKPVKIDEAANGIFHDVAWAKPSNQAAKEISQVKQAQKMLSELGYDIGGADGAIGPRTRAAIMSFERANSLPETGRVNAAIIDRLELATGA